MKIAALLVRISSRAFAPGRTVLGLAALALTSLSAEQVHLLTERLFDGDTEGHHSYRIPSLIRTKAGTLIAFAEGRRGSNADFVETNLVCKRSFDNGATWTPLEMIEGVGAGSWTNPTAVADMTTGRVWLFYNWAAEEINSISDITAWGQRRIYRCYSDDEGGTWKGKTDMTATLLPPDYEFDAVGPGVGIQTTVTAPGRLIIPATRRNLYSDDHGVTWQYQIIPGTTGESTIVECSDGLLLRNDRATKSVWEDAKRRRVSYGTIEDGFAPFVPHDDLLCPKCEASILRYNMNEPDRIIFLNSASTQRRGKMMVRISYDDGVTWPKSRFLYDWMTPEEAADAGKGGYSSLAKSADNRIVALVEINESGATSDDDAHISIDFHKFNLEWIRSGTPDP